MGCEGKAIPWNELISPEQKGLREMLFPGISEGLQEGPQAPTFPVNAPWDPSFGAGMNMFRGMGGLPQNYTPHQMPIFFDPSWNPKWPGFGDYSPSNIDWDSSIIDDPDNPSDPINQPNKQWDWNQWYPGHPWMPPPSGYYG